MDFVEFHVIVRDFVKKKIMSVINQNAMTRLEEEKRGGGGRDQVIQGAKEGVSGRSEIIHGDALYRCQGEKHEIDSTLVGKG